MIFPHFTKKLRAFSENKKTGPALGESRLFDVFRYQAMYAYCLSALLGSANGAGACTSAAVDASVSVDNVLAVALGNCVYGAAVCASAARNALIGNYVCHIGILL